MFICIHKGWEGEPVRDRLSTRFGKWSISDWNFWRLWLMSQHLSFETWRSLFHCTFSTPVPYPILDPSSLPLPRPQPASQPVEIGVYGPTYSFVLSPSAAPAGSSSPSIHPSIHPSTAPHRTDSITDRGLPLGHSWSSEEIWSPAIDSHPVGKLFISGRS